MRKKSNNDPIEDENRGEGLLNYKSLLKIIEAMPVGVFIADKGGKIVFGNEAGKKIWYGEKNVKPEKKSEYKARWLKNGEEITSEERALSRAIFKNQISNDEEIEIECFDGTKKIILNSAAPIYDEQKNICGGFALNRDITVQKEIEKKVKDIARFLQENPNPVLRIAKDMTLLYGNMAGVRLFSKRKISFGKKVPGGWHRALQKTWNEKKSSTLEKEINGVSWMFFLVPVNTYGYINVFGVNVSELKKTQKKLKEAKEIAEKANRHKDFFMACMSHEIRTPLNAIIGFSEIALEEDLPYETEESLKLILDSANSLLIFINHILDHSKICLNKFKFEERVFHFEKIIKNCILLVQPYISLKPVELTYLIKDTPEYLVGDPLRVQQILLNLLHNAAKNSEKGKINVSVQGFEKESNRIDLLIAVSDQGIGIPKNKITDIFESFVQVKNSVAKKFDGSGLGLTICKEIINLMGGNINVKSQVGEGTVFTINLPLKKTKKDQQEFSRSNKRRNNFPLNPPGLKILIAEDDETNQILLEKILTKLGQRVEIASDGCQALELGLKDNFDLILMDLQMPEMDGYKVTKKLRESGCNTPVIALTGLVNLKDKKKCIRMGMNDYLAKPFKKIDLQKIIGKFIPNKKAPRC